MTQQRVAHCYDLMDSAYDAKRIYAHSSALGHVHIIDPNPRNRKAEYGLEQMAQRIAGYYTSGACTVSSTVERAFEYLKDEFGARHVRVRGYQKVVCTCVRRARAHRGSIATDGPINRIRACMQNLGTLNYRCLGIGVENAHRSSTKFTPLTPHWSQITGRFLGSTEPIAIIHAIWAN